MRQGGELWGCGGGVPIQEGRSSMPCLCGVAATAPHRGATSAASQAHDVSPRPTCWPSPPLGGGGGCGLGGGVRFRRWSVGRAPPPFSGRMLQSAWSAPHVSPSSTLELPAAVGCRVFSRRDVWRSGQKAWLWRTGLGLLASRAASGSQRMVFSGHTDSHGEFRRR